jgi:hypothetical protein
MEEKLAKFASSIVGGSTILAGIILLLIFGAPMLINGELNMQKDAFILKIFLVASLYLVSIVLLATLPGKTVKRRSLSWGFSIIFHTGLLFYLGVTNQLGGIVFLLAIVETTILFLSVCGLSSLAYDHYKSKQA